MNFTATFYEPYMLGLLIKKSDKLYIHFKYDLLDENGFFKDEYKHLNGMFLEKLFDPLDDKYVNHTIVQTSPVKSMYRLFNEYCAKDKDIEPLGTKNREKIYKWKRIDLQFDFRSK